MTYEIYNQDNLNIDFEQDFDLVYADMIYEDSNIFPWVNRYWKSLKDNGIFIIQTDWHTNYIVRWYLESCEILGILGNQKPVFVNHLVWKNEWGNHPKNKFHQCYDDIIIYAKGNNYKFYPERIQVDKVTKNKGLNPSGRDTKTATAWIDDICLTTTSKERIKKSDGHLIKWQKPLKLFDRIILPFTDEGDWICEPFGGTFPVVRWSILNNRNCIGIENDIETFNIGKEEVNKNKILSGK
jgi:DNA modification methylase